MNIVLPSHFSFDDPDVLQLAAAREKAIAAGGARLSEILTEFDTNNAFDAGTLLHSAVNQRAVVVVSLETQTPYTIQLFPNSVTETSAKGVLGIIGNRTLKADRRRPVTFLRGPQGQIKVRAGW